MSDTKSYTEGWPSDDDLHSSFAECEEITDSDPDECIDTPHELNEGNKHDPGTSLMPYMFEPLVQSVDDCSIGVTAVSTKANRLLNRDWCTCGECQIMATADECVCCKEHDQVVCKCQEVEDLAIGEMPECVTKHPGFGAVCLNEWNLQAVYKEYKQQYGDMTHPTNEKFRYSAYRHFVRWCWGFLGKRIRVILPACVVTVIRRTFPAENEDGYRGFLLPKLD